MPSHKLARGPRSWPPGLPMPLTAFVGRERELAEIARLVTANRLVTLTGTGGVGKTRTAIEVAAGTRAAFRDGVSLVDLSAVSDAALLPEAAARALGVEDRSGADLTQQLIRVLRPQCQLVVLDNCEHLRAAAARLAADLLAGCPGVTILATSRESLALPGEVTWRVPSLTFPWPEHRPALAELTSFEAAALFVARAREACPGLTVGPGEVAAVTAICFRLDGIPLALELAAALAGALSLPDIARRLDGHFDLLAGSGAAAPRHQTLHASVDWSWRLLAADEQALLRRLAVFAGGWSLDAAELVCGEGQGPPGTTARLLAALAGKSLVSVESSGPERRYRLLETIRAFAAEELTGSGERARLSARHAGYFADLAEQSAPGLLGPGQAGWLRRLDQENENFEAAHQWCHADPGRAGLELRIAAGLAEYWQLRGRVADGTRRLEEALASGAGPASARAAACNLLGVLAGISGQHERGSELFRQSITWFEQAGDQRGQSRAWTHLGNTQSFQGDRAGAAAAYARGLALAQASGSGWHEGYALCLSGGAAVLAGDPVAGQPHLAASLELFAAAGDRRGTGWSLVMLGACLLAQDQPAQAHQVARGSMVIFEELTDRWGLVCAASVLAGTCAAAADWPQAAALLGAADALSERIGATPFPTMLGGLAAVGSAAAAALGPAAGHWRQVGRTAARRDAITAALWPDPADAGLAPPPAAGALTGRELEVAGLIAQGLTNRQIGGRLFIAERTVDTHVSRILAKLDCSSRAQVAATIAAASASGAG